VSMDGYTTHTPLPCPCRAHAAARLVATPSMRLLPAYFPAFFTTSRTATPTRSVTPRTTLFRIPLTLKLYAHTLTAPRFTHRTRVRAHLLRYRAPTRHRTRATAAPHARHTPSPKRALYLAHLPFTRMHCLSTAMPASTACHTTTCFHHCATAACLRPHHPCPPRTPRTPPPPHHPHTTAPPPHHPTPRLHTAPPTTTARCTRGQP